MEPLFAIRLTVPGDAAGPFADALEAFAQAVSAFEVAPGGDWRIEGIGPAPDKAVLGAALALVAASCGIAEPDIAVEPVPARDWVAENQRSFKPIRAGRFLVHPSHDRPTAPGKIALCIDAGEAFGSGEHETTRGCLLALDDLARRWPPGRGLARNLGRPLGFPMGFGSQPSLGLAGVPSLGLGGVPSWGLDLGCGTGVLALAMARVWRAPVLAVDLAPEAVRVARDNARINRAASLVRAIQADGYKARAVRRRRYALIAANILQRPLIAMAPALARRLAPGGRAILSGFYVDQAQAVIAAHRARGLVLERRYVLGAWCAAVLRRPAGEESAEIRD